MFKTSLLFHNSALGQLPRSARQTGPPGPLTWGNNDDSLTHEKTLILSGNGHHPARLRGLDKPVCHQVLIHLFSSPLLFVFRPSCFTASHYLLSLMLTFSFSHHLYPLAPLFHPSVLPFCISPPASVPASLIPTGAVIPSPRRRLNDFILPRLCLLPLMMCLPPSHFDVEYHSLLACVCVCVCWE